MQSPSLPTVAATAPATVFTIDNCPYCEAVKRLLTQLKVPYAERRVTDFDEIRRLKETYAWRTFPMVIVGGQFIGGYDDTKALHMAGKLLPLVNATT